MERKQKTFLIAPVRGYAPGFWSNAVTILENYFEVYWPARDTNQNDPVGYDICTRHRAAIEAADMVHVFWDGQSQGCLFDLGMAFALNKRVIVMLLPGPTEGKSFQNMVRHWARLGEDDDRCS